MSNPDLEKLQQLLRKEIQCHQILVAKMKSDPQNGELKKDLHNQQMKITNLSEKQKKVVEQLRSELGIKKEPGTTTTCSKEQTPTPLSTSQNLNIPSHRSHHKSHHHGQRPILLMGGSQLPGTPPRMSIMTNKPSVVAIKVPNVASRLTASRALSLKESKDNNSNIYKKPIHVPKHSYISSSIENTEPRKALTPEEKKLEFMAALGLITQKTAEQLQSRRSERKRRSTANPQFSNYDRNDVESRRSASSFLAANGLGQEKRRRGGRYSPGTENDINGLNGAIQRKGADLNGKEGKPWNSTVAVVNSYLHHKNKKEHEKTRLHTRAAELRNERLLLEEKAKLLNESIAKQMMAKNTLMDHFRKTETAISQLKDFITLFPPH